MSNNIFDLFKKISTEKPQTDNNFTHMVVGLGNPGDKYAFTRHNAGFLFLDYISQKDGITINRIKFKGLCGQGAIYGKRVLFLAPQTFMNNSGEAVAQAASFYKIPPENIIVCFDDISLEVGKMRIRRKGSDGGHNGLKSIIYHLQSDNFPRIKIGVGAKPHPEMDLADWVLSKFSDSDKQKLKEVFEKASESYKLIIDGKTEQAMALYN